MCVCVCVCVCVCGLCVCVSLSLPPPPPPPPPPTTDSANVTVCQAGHPWNGATQQRNSSHVPLFPPDLPVCHKVIPGPVKCWEENTFRVCLFPDLPVCQKVIPGPVKCWEENTSFAPVFSLTCRCDRHPWTAAILEGKLFSHLSFL